MNDSTLDIDDEDLLDNDQFDDAFEDIEEPSVDTITVTETNEGGRKRLWMILAIVSFALALLSSLLLSPMISTQLQRVGISAELINSIEAVQASAAQALTESGQYSSVETNMSEAETLVGALTEPTGISSSMAGLVFGNGQYNSELSGAWGNYRSTLDSFFATEEPVMDIKQKLTELRTTVSSAMIKSVDFAEAVAAEGRAQNSDANKDRYLFLTAVASDLNGILGRISSSVGNYYAVDEDVANTSNAQNGLIVQLQDTLNRILANAAEIVTTAAEPVREDYDALAATTADISNRVGSLVSARGQISTLSTQGEELTDAVNRAQNQSNLLGFLATIGNFLPIIFALLGAYALWRFSRSQSSDMVANEAMLEITLAEQQESILKLLDEMSALADGDLTVEAEVTDQITGAIADSVNYAVIEMRDLVSQINRASLEVARESASAVNSAQSVSQSNAKQAQEISSAAQLMERVTSSMRAMSEQANESAAMAAESINAANQGTTAVRDTIKGMEDMREQIQDTSKRIKRLGESSQRIGDIVALIDDIAEQTNILSLNAAIQASMAGEAGRGFAVVSDEVQTLAERSTEATKKIAALVTTIQNDTNDAVLSMEKATQQVVAGTRIADTAGTALSDIENVSKNLSTLVDDISKGSSEQADVVTTVTEQVSNVSKSSVETSQKSQESANAIAKLLELAKELESSVSRFKLPAS